MKRWGTIWSQTESGIFIPDGWMGEVTRSSKQTYLSIKEKALATEAVYLENSLVIPNESDLSKLIESTKTLSDAWITNQRDVISEGLLCLVACADRIYDAILSVQHLDNRTHYLKTLLKGNLDLLGRGQSKAKDTLWEMELRLLLQRRSLDAKLLDPPDIVVCLPDATVGIACKKIYSTKHIQNVLSQAVRQVEDKYTIGIVALNLDDLTPPNKILRTPSQEDFSRHLSEWNAQFVREHDRHFRKYLANGRVVSVYISTTVVANIANRSPRINTGMQCTIWNIPGLAPEKDRTLKFLYDKL